MATSPIITVIIILVVVFFIALVLPPMLAPSPPISVKSSLDPSTIRENERAKLTLSFENSDLKTHDIKLVFDTSPRILIYAGTEQLLQDKTYSFTLEAVDPSEERVFTVTGSLEEKVSSCEYPINLKIYVDGNELQKTWDDIVLIVKKS